MSGLYVSVAVVCLSTCTCAWTSGHRRQGHGDGHGHVRACDMCMQYFMCMLINHVRLHAPLRFRDWVQDLEACVDAFAPAATSFIQFNQIKGSRGCVFITISSNRQYWYRTIATINIKVNYGKVPCAVSWPLSWSNQRARRSSAPAARCYHPG